MSISKKSSEEAKKGSWGWIETGTSVFAFLNVLVVSLVIVPCVILLCLLPIDLLIEGSSDMGGCGIVFFVTNAVVFITFLFAVLLYLGIYQKKPKLVLAYCIFGVIVVIALVLTVLALPYFHLYIDGNKYLRQFFEDACDPARNVIIGVAVVYTPILIMIWRTWFLMNSRRLADHEKLINNYYESDWRIN